jgi:beta-ribofuranosylaminobenzene 5'-phosphate synthase
MQIRVKSVCRLHFGFLDLTGDLGRLYGSIGVALENPKTVVTTTTAEKLIIENGNRKKILGFVEKFSKHYQVHPTARIHLLESIPEHSGLGSGTQLALAVASALAKICGIDADARELSSIMGRGKRSGIGIASFQFGGFIMDGGRKRVRLDDLDTPPQIIFRYDFPTNWYFVVVIPETEKGLFGKKEDNLINCLKPSKKISEEICRLTQIKLLPSLVEKDIEEFGAALTEIDLRNGMFFEELQGGIYRGKFAKNLMEFLLSSGVYGVGQSSWGPTIYGLVDDTNAQDVAQKMKDFLVRMNLSGKVFVSRCSNTGAEITIRDSQFDVGTDQEEGLLY